MEKIIKEGQPSIFVKDPKKVIDFLPQNDTILSVRIKDEGRNILYADAGWYKIEKTNAKKGIYAGNICTICEQGEVVDSGGCATCSLCGAQLKCGL